MQNGFKNASTDCLGYLQEILDYLCFFFFSILYSPYILLWGKMKHTLTKYKSRCLGMLYLKGSNIRVKSHVNMLGA